MSRILSDWVDKIIGVDFVYLDEELESNMVKSVWLRLVGFDNNGILVESFKGIMKYITFSAIQLFLFGIYIFAYYTLNKYYEIKK